MVIISYDKKNVYNVSDRLYYELDSKDCTHRCIFAMTKEFLSAKGESFNPYDPVVYSTTEYGTTEHSVCQKIPKNDIVLYEEAVCSKWLQILPGLKTREVDTTPVLPPGFENDTPVIHTYIPPTPPIPPNLSKKEEYKYWVRRIEELELLKNSPSVYDIKGDFPPQNPRYKYDEYGFPYLENYVITLKMKMNGTMHSYIVGYYTEKDRFESAVNEMTLRIKKGKDCLDFSEL